MFVVPNYFSLLYSGYENSNLAIDFGEKLRFAQIKEP
jgi:hypothetical protein